MHTAIAAGDVKARCFRLLDDIAKTREPLPHPFIMGIAAPGRRAGIEG